MRVTGWSAAESVLSAGETWGISSSGFLLLYVPIAIFAVGVGFRLRYRMVSAPAAAPAGELTVPELGLLTSDRRAVMASVALLRSHELIDAGGHPTGQSAASAGLDPFTAAVAGRLDESNQSITGVTRRVRAELDVLRGSLVERGYLAGGHFTKELREAGLPIVVVALFGVVRLIAGVAAGNPVIFLVIVLLLLALSWWRVVAAVRITPAGRAALDRAIADNRYLRPENAPAYTTYGPAAAGLAVAVFGVHALVLLDPALNTAMSGFGNESAGGGDSGGAGDGGGDGGGCGGGGGGCGGCGG